MKVSNGIYENYWENGNLGVYCYYKNGLLHGYYESYYRNGRLSQRGNYVKRIQVGHWITYTVKGFVMLYKI